MAVSYKLTIDRARATQIGADAAYREVVDVTRRVLNQATIDTPVDTGRLRAGNQSHVDRQGPVAVGVVFNNTDYAPAVHDGSRAYTVRPRSKKVLRFTVGGEVIYARYARIPAREGRPWLYRALQKVAVPRGYTVTRI